MRSVQITDDNKDHCGVTSFDIYSYEGSDIGPSSIGYQGYIKKKRLTILVSIFILLIAIILAACIGPIHIPISEVMVDIFTLNTSGNGRIIWNIRMVRIFAAIFAGAGLAISGTVMQCILRNPLASPYTLGLSNAAAFGASFAIIFAGAGTGFSSIISITNPYVTVTCAFIASMIATSLILILTKVTHVSAETMVLAGVAISAIFSAGLSFMQYIATDSQLGNIITWMFGDLGKSTWEWNSIILVVLVPITMYFFYKRWDYNAMEAGEESAKGLGIHTERERVIGLVLASILCATIVSFFGIIAFIGLLAPHIARMLIGSDHRYLIPLSIVIGAIIIVLSDAAGMCILYPKVLPVGIITSILGGPMFIYLLIRRYRR